MFGRFAFCSLLLLTLSACSADQPLRIGADAPVIEAAGFKSSAPAGVQPPYMLVDLSAEVIAALREKPASNARASAAPPPALPLGVGDVVQVTIFESQAGGLFIPASATGNAANSVTLPQQTVDQSGRISVPYAGAVKVAGLGITEVQHVIEARLKAKAIEPQAVVSLISRKSADVSVIGEVGTPGTFQIDGGGTRLLDMLSKAGGPKNAGFATAVSLQRKGVTRDISFTALMENPAANVYVQPGDVIYVSRQSPFFLAYSASGKNGRYDIDAEHLSLADAVARTGGLSRGGSGPRQVYLYRIEDRAALERAGLIAPGLQTYGSRVPVIYRTSLRDPSGMFLAQSFTLRGRDIVYASNGMGTALADFVSVLKDVVRVRPDGSISTD